MKNKILSLSFWLCVLVVLYTILNGCQIKSYTPVIPTSFASNAVVNAGDFSYSCTVDITPNSTKLTVNSTKAKGLIMLYDSKNITFTQGTLTYTLNADNIDKTNPAIMLHQVFQAMQNQDSVTSQITDNGYQYSGVIAVGKFVLFQNNNGNYTCLQLPDADVTIEFELI